MAVGSSIIGNHKEAMVPGWDRESLRGRVKKHTGAECRALALKVRAAFIPKGCQTGPLHSYQRSLSTDKFNLTTAYVGLCHHMPYMVNTHWSCYSPIRAEGKESIDIVFKEQVCRKRVRTLQGSRTPLLEFPWELSHLKMLHSLITLQLTQFIKCICNYQEMFLHCWAESRLPC